MAGRVWLFGDNITTDDIIAGKYKHSTIEAEELVRHLMENVRPGFVDELSAGDFIVAGRNFGCGSSREQAPQIIRQAGVRAVIARSFARIFFRNSINIGLRVIAAPLDDIAEGDLLTLDEEGSCIVHPRTGRTWPVPPLEGALREIESAGGLLNLVKTSGDLR